MAQPETQYRPADMSGPAGAAWIPDLAKVRRERDHDATLWSALVRVPGAHPFWSWWLLTVLHLRDIPGVRPAHLHFQGAEHEFSIIAIDPSEEGEPNLEAFERRKQDGFPLLTPIDVCEQFAGMTDAQAVKLGQGALRAILAGQMSPDQDFRAAWKLMLAGTVNHLRTGAHDSN